MQSTSTRECSSPSSIFAGMLSLFAPQPSPALRPPSPAPAGEGHSQSLSHTRSPSARNRSATARTTAVSFELWLRKTSWVKSSAGIAFIGRLCRTNTEESQAPSGRHIHSHRIVQTYETGWWNVRPHPGPLPQERENSFAVTGEFAHALLIVRSHAKSKAPEIAREANQLSESAIAAPSPRGRGPG